MHIFFTAKEPKISPFHFDNELSAGMRAAVICTVIDGDPPFDFSWYKDGATLQENAQVSFKTHEFMSTLFILNLGPDSNGNYTCRVSNRYGNDEKFDALSMKGKNEVFRSNVLLILCHLFESV